jgi:hypothetical protein
VSFLLHGFGLDLIQILSLILDQFFRRRSELSKLRVKVVSLNGKLSINGLKIDQGKTVLLNLTKEYDFHGREGVVKNYGEYCSIIEFVSYKNVPAEDNLCDFILTIEDPHGITRATGLHVHGGFTDSL